MDNYHILAICVQVSFCVQSSKRLLLPLCCLPAVFIPSWMSKDSSSPISSESRGRGHCMEQSSPTCLTAPIAASLLLSWEGYSYFSCSKLTDVIHAWLVHRMDLEGKVFKMSKTWYPSLQCKICPSEGSSICDTASRTGKYVLESVFIFQIKKLCEYSAGKMHFFGQKFYLFVVA